MPAGLLSKRSTQMILALLLGTAFGFALQRGGVTEYSVILGQLLLRDFTVVKVMLSAVITGMAGVYLLKSLGLARLHPKTGSLGSLLPGGLLFGAGFALLGYCPGTLAAAAGAGKLDAALAGIPGMIIGAWCYALVYPFLRKRVLGKGHFGERTIPDLLGLSPWIVVPLFLVLLSALLYLLEKG